MADNKGLLNAKNQKFDEYFTEYSSISNELPHYRSHFKGQIVYCNCDDPAWSNFWKFFHSNFASLGLKKLIATHYARDSEPSYAMIYEGGNDFDLDAGMIVEIRGNAVNVDGNIIFYNAGDFRSDACVELLKESTLVVTNPPFSLFREYVAQLLAYDKKFIIIGHMTAINNKDFFPLIKNNQIWTGYKKFGGGMDMIVPPDVFDKEKVKNYHVDSAGNYIVNVMGVIWYTNIDTSKRHDGLWHKNGKFDDSQAHHYYEGNEDTYVKFDNYDGIDISILKPNGKREGTCDIIPIDYAGNMAVPITIFDKYNPDELEIVGLPTGVSGASIGVTRNYRGRTDIAFTMPNGEKKCPFSRVIVRNRNPIKKSDDLGY